MNKIIYFSIVLLLFISCDIGHTLDELCLYSETSVVVGTKEIPKLNSESIVVDRYSNSMWLIKHSESKIKMKDFNNPQVYIELNIENGRLNYLYDDCLFNGKYITRIMFDDSQKHIIQKLIIFDIFSSFYKLIEIDSSRPYRICGLDNSFIYLYVYDNIINKINYQTLEKEEFSFDLFNPGYCTEEGAFIGVNDKNNICILKDGIRHELPIKGIRYKSNTEYVDITNLYYFTNNKIYYAKKDVVGYIKGIFTFAIFLDGLGPVKWYCYDLKTKKSTKINNKGYSFLCELR